MRNEALSTACEKGYVDIVELLIKDLRVDPFYPDNYPLHRACEKGHLEIVKILLRDKRVNAIDNNISFFDRNVRIK